MVQPFVAVPSYAVPGVAGSSCAGAVAASPANPSTAAGTRPLAAPQRAPTPRHRTVPTDAAGTVPQDSAEPAYSPTRPGTDRSDLRALGPLAGYAEDPETTDLFVNGESGLWIDAGHGLAFAPAWQLGEAEVRALAVRLIALGGRHIDEASPCVDVRLADGIRVHAVLPPVSSTGTLLSIRLPHAAHRSLGALADAGLFGVGEASAARLNRLRAAVRGRQNLLITGAAGSGKTTLLAALLGEAPADERIVAIEDVAELRILHPHVVALEARQANLEGAGRIGLEALLREALRMRPDRLVLGECRGSEIRELLAALNTGHDGGAGTLHANSLDDVPARLEALGALAGMSAAAVARQTVSAIGLVLHLERTEGVRRLEAVGRFTLNGRDRLAIEAL
ncbi:TadA family conjugal transfer-associated ATPase [Cryobacterium sp. TMS1-13-1]|uniref:TadA family conjugal transfer-associated ATPase n=1 Tax=Cryobacterium sp. TMS1-13-1 TaxID=1259220 RepID=UPI00106AFFAA|nr:TadA family conjugal transfer-associated ATPase [Cryobacterium sp. TMS1-13-1]TFD22095.1 TadA family conjugal transfer-associated ATPase [Cryobacterium sp. TMS1-13-1]